MDLLKHFSNQGKLEGPKNFIPWSFCIKTILRNNEVWDEVIDVPTNAPILLVEDLKKKKFRAIVEIQATMKDIILPTVRRYNDDPITLWTQLK